MLRGLASRVRGASAILMVAVGGWGCSDALVEPLEPEPPTPPEPPPPLPKQPQLSLPPTFEPPDDEGEPCGECSAGRLSGGECVYPGIAPYLRGLPPADTGDREVFDPDDFTGTDTGKVRQAILAAEAVEGAVVMHRVYETTATLRIGSGIMLTGGGLRRACTPVSTLVQPATATTDCVLVDGPPEFEPGEFLMAVTGPTFAEHIANIGVDFTTPDAICANAPIGVDLPVGTQLVRHSNLISVINPTDDVIIDAVLFDGANRCNAYTHDWRFNNAITFRGDNIVRNSVFYDSPGESITSCGAEIVGNFGFELQGSLVHKSCPDDPEPLDVLAGNYVAFANLATDEVMQHSEGLVTHSSNGGTIESSDNVFRYGSEGVFGFAGADDTGVVAEDDCYAHFSHVIEIYGGATEDEFSFDVELIDVPTIFK